MIRGGYETYTFILEKEGYLSQTLKFSAKELLETTKENPLILTNPGVHSSESLSFNPDPKKERMQ